MRLSEHCSRHGKNAIKETQRGAEWGSHVRPLQGIHVTHQEFRFGDGSSGSRASEVFTSLQSGRMGHDCNGHGTHVAAAAAGLTYGVAKNASLLAVRSLECLGNGTVSQVCMLTYLREIIPSLKIAWK